jgi:hypothetical protein
MNFDIRSSLTERRSGAGAELWASVACPVVDRRMGCNQQCRAVEQGGHAKQKIGLWVIAQGHRRQAGLPTGQRTRSVATEGAVANGRRHTALEGWHEWKEQGSLATHNRPKDRPLHRARDSAFQSRSSDGFL